MFIIFAGTDRRQTNEETLNIYSDRCTLYSRDNIMIVSPLIRIAALIAAHSLPETNLLFNQLFTEKKDL